MMVKIVVHNYETANEVITGVNSMAITRAYDNRIIWADGDICAPFFVVPDDVEVQSGDPVEKIQQHDIADSLSGDGLYLELLKRIQKLESEKGGETGESG